MNNKKGVTLASLTVYVVVLIIVLVILTFISANYTSQITQVTSRGRLSNECVKLYSFLISDSKAANSVVEFGDDFLRFDNDVKYTIKYIRNRATETMQYEVYRNDVLISENLLDANFEYDAEDRIVSFDVKYIYGNVLFEKTQSVQVGRGY